MGRRRAAAVLLGGAVALSVTAAPEDAWACDCTGPWEPFEELVQAAQVFEAQLLYELPRELNSSRCAWQVKMLRAWKGTTTKKDEPVVNDCWCAKTGLEAGKRYIFYTSEYRSDGRTIHMCSRVVPADQAAEDLAELGEPTEVRDPSQPLPVGPPAQKADKPAAKPLRKWQPLGLPSCSSSGNSPSPASTHGLWALFVALGLAAGTRRSDKGHGAVLGATARCSCAAALVRGLWIAVCLLWGCDTPCANDADCGQNGGCVFDWCYEKQAYCKDRSDCKEEGRCTLHEGECIVGPKDDCKQSEDCRIQGECTPANGRCIIASDADCEQSESCSSGGRCTHQNGKCTLTKSEDCARSEGCKDYGNCIYRDGSCQRLNQDDCRRSKVSCQRDGQCSLKFPFCVAASNEDCAGSTRCKDYGACLARNDHCVRSCEKWFGCKRSGKCHDDGERCASGPAPAPAGK